MKESITEPTTHFTACASLAAIGLKVKQLDLFGPIRQKVHIEQKTVKYSPHDKLYDSFSTMLAGAHGQVEINTRLRSDPARPRRLWTKWVCRPIGGPAHLE